MRAQLIDCEATILREIATDEIRQRDVAQTYRLAMDSTDAATLNWAKINAAIVARWSKSGLIAIKKSAHSGKCFA